MKKIILLTTIIVAFLMQVSFAQSVGINSDGSSPDASAMLDVKSSTKGFLAPRMASLPATGSLPDGLIVYKNDGLEADMGYYYCKNNTWIKIGDATDATQWTTSGSNIYYNSGNVGIGTTTPGYKLTVQNGEIVSASDTDAGLVFTGTDGTANDMTVRYDRPNARLEFRDNLNSQTRMVVEQDGNVGIGTTTPEARLHIGGFGYGVLGGITMTPDNDTEGGHYMTFTNAASTTDIGSIARGPGLTVVYNTSSDYRLKENVVNIDINQAKSRLMSLRPVEYNYISDQNKTVISGFFGT